ncbi:FecCD family ABC transporter permease [Actinobacillus delphinicola]|uniref:Hemin transport system permease HmuU n=1 Tax=Actinobacillus delphinicola TaxID=51161 RepID=A0A448TTY0_9PAST|nr:iron ABC transporter permease [Actinobacillus delphinicola]VEJ09258.1 hemin transport system permease HmuU [Actinobacillus delphinicola]
MRHKDSRKINLILMILLLVVSMFSLTLGQYPVGFAKIICSFTSQTHLTAIDKHILLDIRLPRVLLAIGVGGLLAFSGAILQGVFHNPLVDPHIIGVSSGAAFGGTLAILLGFSTFGLMLNTFFFGLLALALIYLLASLFGQSDRLMLILLGIVLSGIFAALVHLVQYLADTEEKLPNIVFWLLGSFSTANWQKLGLVWIPIVIFGGVLYKLRWRINILSLGDIEAKALGLHVTPLRYCVLFLSALLIASQVAVTGAVGWIGLVVPHIGRLLVGADHRKLLGTTFLAGAIIMLLVDDLARTLSQSEIPLSIITALFGAPLFIFLLAKNKSWRK